MISLRLVVQHHPSRAHLLLALLDRLGECEVVVDPEPDGVPSPLRTYISALSRPLNDATHVLIIQDDARPCLGFRERVLAALAERPDGLVCFYASHSAGGGGNRVRRAAAAGECWASIGSGGWVPAVATCWPLDLIDPFLDFCAHPKFAKQRADDGMIARFVRRHRPRVEVWATVPSLVEHPDHEPSLIGKKHGGGTIRWRTAALFDDS